MVVRSVTDHREAPPMLTTEDLAKMTFVQLADLHHHLSEAHHSTHLAWRLVASVTGNPFTSLDHVTSDLFDNLMRVNTALTTHPEHPANAKAAGTILIGTEGVRVRPGAHVISANGNPATLVGRMTADGSLLALKLDNGRQVTCSATLVTLNSHCECCR